MNSERIKSRVAPVTASELGQTGPELCSTFSRVCPEAPTPNH